MRRILAIVGFASLVACAPPTPRASAPTSSAPAAMAPAQVAAPAGAYEADPSHTSVLFRVNHLGLSHYTARFTRVDAQLQFNPADPTKSSVVATIDPRSIQTDFPLPKPNFDQQLQNDQWLDTKKFAQITFRSTKIEMTGADSARITGDLTLHGITAPVVLDAAFNGEHVAGAGDPIGTRLGFSAHGVLKRSAFGVAFGIPQPGSTMGVGDDVEIVIETEFLKPGSAAPPPAH